LRALSKTARYNTAKETLKTKKGGWNNPSLLLSVAINVRVAILKQHMWVCALYNNLEMGRDPDLCASGALHRRGLILKNSAISRRQRWKKSTLRQTGLLGRSLAKTGILRLNSQNFIQFRSKWSMLLARQVVRYF